MKRTLMKEIYLFDKDGNSHLIGESGDDFNERFYRPISGTTVVDHNGCHRDRTHAKYVRKVLIDEMDNRNYIKPTEIERLTRFYDLCTDFNLRDMYLGQLKERLDRNDIRNPRLYVLHLYMSDLSVLTFKYLTDDERNEKIKLLRRICKEDLPICREVPIEV